MIIVGGIIIILYVVNHFKPEKFVPLWKNLSTWTLSSSSWNIKAGVPQKILHDALKKGHNNRYTIKQLTAHA